MAKQAGGIAAQAVQRSWVDVLPQMRGEPDWLATRMALATVTELALSFHPIAKAAYDCDLLRLPRLQSTPPSPKAAAIASIPTGQQARSTALPKQSDFAIEAARSEVRWQAKPHQA
jgi:hypothetical protein